MSFSDRAIERILEILKAKESYQDMDQSTIDKGFSFIQSYLNIFTYEGEKSKSFYCFWHYDEVIRYCYLDKADAFKRRDKVAQQLTRISYVQNHQPFDSLTINAKSELESLLVMWSEVVSMQNDDFLFKTKQSNRSELPDILNLGCTKWTEVQKIEPHEWQRVMRA